MGRRGSTLLFSLCGANGPRTGTGRQAVFARWAHVPLSAVAGLSSLRARWGATASRVIPIHGQYIRSLPACQGFRRAERSAGCRSTILDRREKEMKDGDASGIAGVAANNCTKGDHILHGKKYNTGHGIQAITDEVCGEIRREPCEPEIQQKPLVHLLLESALGWKRGIPCLSVQTAEPPSKPAYGG